MNTFRAIDPTSLAKHFDSARAEERWSEAWERLGLYRYDPTAPREATFAVDTPPPTVSGSLHVGHVFSYTQTDVVVRYQRMCGRNIFYPMGWDDNGLPTERRVQNYFHVRVDIHAPYEPELKLGPATAEQRREQAPRSVSRPNFLKLCHEMTHEDERVFKELWRRLALSVDWEQEYATIDDRCRKLAQLSFRDLYEKGHIYSAFAPTMWDVDFQTAVAQAEIEDRALGGHFHNIAFAVEGSDKHFVIATTRPELLPACVGVAAHPDDPRYRHLFGRRAVTPLFHAPVPIFASAQVDREKGTGILMVCTFGDSADVQWWREQRLPLRQVVDRAGKMAPVRFGEPNWPSRDEAAANRCYGELVGKPLQRARAAIVALLRDPANASARSTGAPLQGEPTPVDRVVKFFEKGDRPLEIMATRQWFVRLLDKKDGLAAAGDRIEWHPPFMAGRYQSWNAGLMQDWCISRQRYFGVQFPVWYPLDEQGVADHQRPIIAPSEQLPVDPTTDVPPGYDASQRGEPGGFVGESDVLDTWFTSSLTPQIGSGWLLDRERHRRLFPFDIRPQSHEIIRTWAYYTVCKAWLHEGEIPWRHVLVSGWVLDPDRKKMSKSKGNVVTPMHLLDKYTADGVRYWAASARLGSDTAFDENVLSVGKRLVTKLFNAAKFVLGQTATPRPISVELDRAFVAVLAQLVQDATDAFERFEYADALAITESFFWSSFTDTFIELAKSRARSDDADARGSAVASLRLGLSVLLRLFAPVLPFVTEEVWSWAFAEETGHASIHRAPWPSVEDFAGVAAPANPGSLKLAATALAAINKCKTDLGASVGRFVRQIQLGANSTTCQALALVLDDVASATRLQRHEVVADLNLADNTIAVASIELEVATSRPAG